MNRNYKAALLVIPVLLMANFWRHSAPPENDMRRDEDYMAGPESESLNVPLWLLERKNRGVESVNTHLVDLFSKAVPVATHATQTTALREEPPKPEVVEKPPFRPTALVNILALNRAGDTPSALIDFEGEVSTVFIGDRVGARYRVARITEAKVILIDVAGK